MVAFDLPDGLYIDRLRQNIRIMLLALVISQCYPLPFMSAIYMP